MLRATTVGPIATLTLGLQSLTGQGLDRRVKPPDTSNDCSDDQEYELDFQEWCHSSSNTVLGVRRQAGMQGLRVDVTTYQSSYKRH